MLGLCATLTEAVFVYLCICVFVYLHIRHLGTFFLRSLYHYLSENIWFVWSKTLHNGEKLRCYSCDWLTDWHTSESRAVFCWGRIRNYRYCLECTKIGLIQKSQRLTRPPPDYSETFMIFIRWYISEIKCWNAWNVHIWTSGNQVGKRSHHFKDHKRCCCCCRHVCL